MKKRSKIGTLPPTALIAWPHGTVPDRTVEVVTGKNTFPFRKYFTKSESPPSGPPAYSTVADSTVPRDGSIYLSVVFRMTLNAILRVSWVPLANSYSRIVEMASPGSVTSTVSPRRDRLAEVSLVNEDPIPTLPPCAFRLEAVYSTSVL